MANFENKVKYTSDKSSLSAEVELYINDKKEASVKVSREKRYGSEGLGRANVNWAAFGSVPTETGKAYAQTILDAVRVGEDFNANEPDLYKVTFTRKNETTGNTDEVTRFVLGVNRAHVVMQFNHLEHINLISAVPTSR